MISLIFIGFALFLGAKIRKTLGNKNATCRKNFFPRLEKLAMPFPNSIFSLQMRIFRLQMSVFRLQMYIFSLKMEILHRIGKFFYPVGSFS